MPILFYLQVKLKDNPNSVIVYIRCQEFDMKFLIFITSLFFSYWIYGAESSSQTRNLFDANGKLTAKFTSLEGKSSVRTFYKYDAKGRIIKITSDNGTSNDPGDMAGVTEQFFTTYQHHPDFQDQDHPTEILQKHLDLVNGKEKLILHTFNTYNAKKELLQRELIDCEGTYTHMTFDKEGKPTSLLKCKKQGEQQRMTLEYDVNGRLLKVSQETREGITELIYDSNGFPILRRQNTSSYPYSDQPWAPDVAESVETFSNLFANLQKAIETISFSKIGSSTLHDLEEGMEKFIISIIGSSNFQKSGFYTYSERAGIYGNGEVNDKIRITLINGILNTPSDHMENLDLFSNTHGGVNIHYIFRPYRGYSRDIMECIGAKGGWISSSARNLAKRWKELIAEMGGVNGGGLIIHYAHSIGATDTYRAKSLMTPEELKMIKVYTIGSPTIIPNKDFHSVMNYTSLRDGVSQFFDPLSYLWGLLDPSANVVFVDTIFGCPIVDHLLTNPAYNAVLDEKGKEFVEGYVKK